MSDTSSPATGRRYGIDLVCDTWDYPRSTFYDQTKRQTREDGRKRGRRGSISDDALTKEIEICMQNSPFRGEGHRKIHARLRRGGGLAVGRNRVLRIMRERHLLSPYRSPPGQGKTHDGTIITEHPNQMWATDATKILTLEDGWVWFFGVIEHGNAECMGWHLSKRGTRFTAIEAMTRALERGYGKAACDVATGLALRVDHGSPFLSDGFVNQVRYWGITLSKGFVREPETNGVVERFHRTFKEQVIHGRDYRSIEDLESAVSVFTARYNEEWMLEKLCYHSPVEARKRYLDGENVVENAFKKRSGGKQRIRGNTISPSLAEREEGHGYSVLADGSISNARV